LKIQVIRDPAQPGGTSWDCTHDDDPAVEAARAFVNEGVPVAAICGATSGLARGGLLDDRAHTSNAKEYLEHQPGYRARRAIAKSARSQIAA
jgi:putative intracellular protease/amidase